MTLATKITISRIFLVPIFASFAVLYSLGVQNENPSETLRWLALGIFITAALSDGIDGWIARRFNQQSKLGAFLDPIADKALILTSILILTFFPWGANSWAIPIWFATLVIFRDCLILAGMRFIYSKGHHVFIKPHWSGKACTVSLFFVIGWVMLKVTPISPIYPCALAAIFTTWSMLEYIKQGITILRSDPPSP